MEQAGQDALAESLAPAVRRSVPLAEFTAIRVGGPADLLIVVNSVDELIGAVSEARRHGVAYRVLGGGCNVLVADEGVRGLVIINRASAISCEDRSVTAESGAGLSALARRTVDCGLAGMEWASGLPGTVGGAIVGNAGAFGGDVGETLRSALILEHGRDTVERDNEWFDFEYRGSRLKCEAGTDRVLLSATFDLEPGEKDRLQARSEEVLRRRRARQPSGPTLGSTFKNPRDRYAGRLIELAALKGYQVGGARVSEKHANFILNTGDASAQDVMALIRHIQLEVDRQFGVKLVLEIELLGW
ncbi:MAG: UDP-N-acetylmuramate dehydrogenase [Anaerolineae bacterium]|jgi:UDP-N-acetylmuramate dehydrogenase